MDTAELDRIAYLTIQSAIEIHKKLGPGLLESVYRPCMMYELQARKLEVTSEVRVPVRYKDLVLERLVVGVDRIVNKFGWPDSQACKSSELPTNKQ
jgi:GxxExxY protein